MRRVGRTRTISTTKKLRIEVAPQLTVAYPLPGMAGKIYVIYDPFRDVDLRETVKDWCESASYEVVDWTPTGHYGDLEIQMSRASMSTCDIALVIVGKAGAQERSLRLETDIARELGLITLQLLSPRATVKYLPGAGIAIGWSEQELLANLQKLAAR